MSKPKLVHLFRGAPAVRYWSKHQETIEAWTLCGISRAKGGLKVRRDAAQATEDASLVTCPYCHQLMRSVSPLTYPKPALRART